MPELDGISLTRHLTTRYSVRNDLTGLATAAFIAKKLIAINAINTANNPASKKTHQLIFMRYAKLFNQLCIAHHVIGMEIINATQTSNKNSFDISTSTCFIDAPSTLRMPISL